MDLSGIYSEDAPFVRPYSLPHILFLLVCAAFIWFFIRYRKTISRTRDTVCRILLCTLAFQQVFLLYGWYWLCTGFDPAVSLPLHISRVTSLLTICFLIFRKDWLLDVVCYFSMWGLISLFYPMNVYNFGHINGWSYMVNHLITVLIPVFAVTAFGWPPSWRGFLRTAAAFTVYFALATLANFLIEGGNYFYQTDRPFLKTLPLWQYAALQMAGTLAAYALATAIYLHIAGKAAKRGNG